jgi:hypothetical protein
VGGGAVDTGALERDATFCWAVVVVVFGVVLGGVTVRAAFVVGDSLVTVDFCGVGAAADAAGGDAAPAEVPGTVAPPT